MNNTPDYNNNLAFAPTSADDLNTKGRDSDVLIKALDKCERLQKQLDIAVEALYTYSITINWFGEYDDTFVRRNGYRLAENALTEIELLKEQSDVAED